LQTVAPKRLMLIVCHLVNTLLGYQLIAFSNLRVQSSHFFLNRANSISFYERGVSRVTD
jgi:hypothetical protein